MTEAEFGRISGVGKQKLREFAQAFLAEIVDHLRANPRQVFADSFTAPPPAKRTLGASVRETLRRFRAGATVEQVARTRGFVANTIYGHLAEAVEAGEKLELDKVITPEQERLIAAAFAQVTLGGLKDIKELLGDKVNYGQLRIFRAARASHA